MEFFKEAKDVDEQLQLLQERGLIVKNKASAKLQLKKIGYYRLSSYMRNYQYGENHNFIENTEFSQILKLYDFDAELRTITLNAISKIEIAHRAAISNIMSKKYDSHWFYKKEAFYSQKCVSQCKSLILKEIKKNKNEYAETFISKYYEKYSKPKLPPSWMVLETFTFGSLNKLYMMLTWEHKRAIASYMGFSHDIKGIVKTNWLFSLCVIRNICAHHSRLFNRIFRIAPTKNEKVEELKNAPNNNFYFIAMIINYYLTTIAKDNSFENGLIKLFKKYPEIDKTKMGFPENWSKFTITPILNK